MGELTKIAKHLRINLTWLSQILSGAKQFNIDQVLELGSYLQLSPPEIEYFILLVQTERASSHKTKQYFKKRIEGMKLESMKVRNQVQYEKTLSDSDKAIFYSSWLYAAIHLMTSIPEKGVSVEEVITAFQIKRTTALDILNFLTRANLCIQSDLNFKSSTQSTFIDSSSPFLPKHHVNWRIKSIEKTESLDEKELMFTAPVSLSHDDFAEVRKELIAAIKKISQRVQISKADTLANLNIDWYLITKR